MKPSLTLISLLAGCAAPAALPGNLISPSSFAGVDLTTAQHAIYMLGHEDYDADNDGELDSTMSYIQFLVSNHEDLCAELNNPFFRYQDLRIGYATAGYFGPLGTELPALTFEGIMVGDYLDGLWIDHGLTIIINNQEVASTGGYGDGSLRIERINDIGEPFSLPDWINDIGEPNHLLSLREQPEKITFINDIGEPLLSIPQINDIGEPLRGLAEGEMHYDTSGRLPFDLDLDGDGVDDATRLSGVPMRLSIQNATLCER
jgi:hypothetical protein